MYYSKISSLESLQMTNLAIMQKVGIFVFSQSEGLHQESNRVTNASKGSGGKEAHIHCWWGCKLVLPLWKSLKGFLKKLKRDTICLSYTTSWYILEKKSAHYRDTCMPMFIITHFTLAELWNKPRSTPTNEQLRKYDIYS